MVGWLVGKLFPWRNSRGGEAVFAAGHAACGLVASTAFCACRDNAGGYMHRHHDKDHEGTLSRLVQSTEELLRRTASVGGAEIEAKRDSLKRHWNEVSSSASDWQEAAGTGLRNLSRAADKCAHRHAWESIGIAALVGAVVTACLLTRNKRRY
ncbi:DUF883 family protein [Bordetella sp. 02P26C-1]|nr:DUF883 family protein [Bordetella sp. 02P26C-1]